METLQKELDDTEQEKIISERVHQDDRDTHYSHLDSPFCYLFHRMVKSLLKCFCHEDSTATASNIEEESETQMKLNEEEYVNINATTSTSLRVSRRPPRSGLSTGSGGQTN